MTKLCWKKFFCTIYTTVLLFGELFPDQQMSLKVGMELSSPPFEMVCKNGYPCGISVEIADALGKYLQRPIEVDNIAFTGLIPSLNSEKIDLILSSLTITKRREGTVSFSEPYVRTGLCMLLKARSSISTIQDANRPEVTVVVKLGTSGEAYAKAELKKAKVRVLEKEGTCVLEVIQRKADLFLYDQLSVYRIWQKNQKTTKAILQPFKEELWAIAVRKGDTTLLNQINAFISQFRQSGGFNQLADKYLHAEKKYFEEHQIPFIF